MPEGGAFIDGRDLREASATVAVLSPNPTRAGFGEPSVCQVRAYFGL